MNPFSTAFIKAPKRARFDFNHQNTVGMRVGVLTPTLTRFIVPGDDVSVSMEQIARLAPMPVPTFCNLKVRHDFFFVPLRLLYGQEYLDKLFGADVSIPRASCKNLLSFTNAFSSFTYALVNEVPGVSSQSEGDPFVPGTLFDYLGYPVFTDRNGALNGEKLSRLAQSVTSFNAGFNGATNMPIYRALNGSKSVTVEPLFAYHFIWRDWYRFTGIQDNSIVESYLSNGVLSAWKYGATDNPTVTFGNTTGANTFISSFFTQMAGYVNGNSPSFGSLGKLKLAHLKKDMFTSVRYGSKPTVLIPTDNGTIPALREASAIQRFLDIVSITGQRYFDKVKGLFGVEPVGPKDDRVQFLARYQQFIKIGEVLTTATTQEATTGDYAGRGVLIDGKYLFKRHFTEHGWLMCISSIVPDVSYDGLSRQLTDILPLDTPLPSLAQVGDQSVFRGEIDFRYDSVTSGPDFNTLSMGDQFRFYAYKSAPSEVHGFFKMETARPWTNLIASPSHVNIIEYTKIRPSYWNYLFNDTDDEYIFGDRFFFNIDFYESITRALPKYINYHL